MMYKSTYIILLSLVTFFYSEKGNAQVTIVTTDLTNPPAMACTNTLYNVAGSLGCTNYGYSGPIVNVAGFNITIDLQYFSGFSPQPGVTPFSENVDLGMLPVGIYTVTANGYLDGMLSSNDVGTFEVFTCCAVNADFLMSATSVCYPDGIVLSNVSSGATNYTWYIDGILFSTASSPGFIAPVPGIYAIELVADDGNCADSTEMNLEVFAMPMVDLGGDTLICDNAILVLDASVANGNYTWQDASTNSSFSVDTAGLYWVQVTDLNGCVATDSIVVSEIDCSLGLAPNDSPLTFLLYPNPASSFITIEGLDESSTVSVYALTGELVIAESHSSMIDVSVLEAGVYMVQVKHTGGSYTQRLNVMK